MMATIATSEGTLTVEDGAELYTKTWKVGMLCDMKQTINVGLQTLGPDGPKAILAFVHGFSDHCQSTSILPTASTKPSRQCLQ